MTKFILTITSLFTFLLFACHNNSTPKSPQLELAKEQIDFGNIKMSADTIWQDVAIKNSGTAPLLIEDVQVSCGCLTSKWSNEPIAPGEQKNISVAIIPKSIELDDPNPIEPFTRMLIIRSNIDDFFTKVNIVGAVDKREAQIG